jgi:cytochrome d ubiquinol oxidase subunit II
MTDICFALIVLCLGMYAVLDGYDLGIGIATLFERDAHHRHEMLEQVAVAWDGNETWLILLGVSLWAGFPLAFGTVLPHAYLPLVVMLFGLIVRGVSVEMASQQRAPRWERAFGIASLLAALAQGLVLGTLTTPLHRHGDAFTGSPFGALGWFAALTAITVACTYLALGYAHMKGTAAGLLRATAGRRGSATVVLAGVLVALSLIAVHGTDASLGLHDPVRIAGFVGLALVASAGALTAVVTLRPASRADAVPMYALAGSTIALLLAWLVARYPAVVPGLAPADAVSPSMTMDFLAIGIGLNMPLVLFYNWFAHHTFGGKVPSAAPAATHVRSAR